MTFSEVDERTRRERAARALCRNAGLSENTIVRGRPRWTWFLDEVYVVLRAMDAPLPDSAGGTPAAVSPGGRLHRAAEHRQSL